MRKQRMRRDRWYMAAIALLFVVGVGSMSIALAVEKPVLADKGVQICLTDSSTGVALANATLSLHQRGNEEKTLLSTDSQGRCTTPPLSPGNIYDIIETQAPEGYITPLRGWSIVVAADGAASAKGKDISSFEENGMLVLNIKNTALGDGTMLETAYDENEIPLSTPLVIGSRADNAFLMALGTCMMLAACVWLMMLLKIRKRGNR